MSQDEQMIIKEIKALSFSQDQMLVIKVAEHTSQSVVDNITAAVIRELRAKGLSIPVFIVTNQEVGLEPLDTQKYA